MTAREQRIATIMAEHLVDQAEYLLRLIEMNVQIDAESEVSPAGRSIQWLAEMKRLVREHTDQVNHYTALWAAAN